MFIHSVKSPRLKQLSPEINKIRELVYNGEGPTRPSVNLRAAADFKISILGG